MESCDVLIVGGGPAGSSCAWKLRGSGLDVAILDKHVFPRDKVCGGWITPEVLDRMEIDAACYAAGRTLQPIVAFRTGMIDGAALETGFGRPVSYGIRRCEFDHYLLKRSGARLFEGAPLTSLDRSGGRWIANGWLRARLVVGAGGHFCPVARLTGAKPAREQTVAAQETEFEMNARQLASCNVRADRPELYFCRDMKGYGWCFRKGNLLNVGLGRADSHGLPAHAAGFFEFLVATKRIGFDVPPLRGHAYLLNGISRRRTVSDSLLLAGDAAGLAYAQSGEGILPAIESGLLAGETVLAAGGNYGAARLESYRLRIAGRQQPWSAGIGRYIPSALIASLGRGVLASSWLTREVVLKSWFLHGR
jgi:menaquinone-9 beta-reductase